MPPKTINSKAIITILLEVKNDDGSAFTYTRTGTAEWSEATIASRRARIQQAVTDQAERFLDEQPHEVTND